MRPPVTHVLDVPMYSDNQLRAACAKATADERERCARLVEQEANDRIGELGRVDIGLYGAADVIRSQEPL
jgi:hypothetical protein